jgi:hypothetical protein
MTYQEILLLGDSNSDSDFTTKSYRRLLSLAKMNYKFVSYKSIPWGEKFINWRHDCDISLNRAYALAKIESEECIKATYFLNPHCEFYNIYEKSQYDLVIKIIEMGHEIGLHFDPAFSQPTNEKELGQQIYYESKLLTDLFGVEPSAFSFHNPIPAIMSYDAEIYGGLINCYSRRFKTEVSYCSDSNGYWRYRRLNQVLSDATEPCLQVLTHPDWWQENSMPPRQRIFRSVYGRANAVMRRNDDQLIAHGRQNQAGAAQNLLFLNTTHTCLFELYDYLWNTGHFQSLFVELWRLHEKQINKLCKAELRNQWRVPAVEVNAFFESPSLAIDGWRLFVGVFGRTWQEAASLEESEYWTWVKLRNTLIHGRSSASPQRLEDGCVFLCSAIESLATWGKDQPIHYDGIDHLGSIGIPTYQPADGSLTDHLEEVAEDISYFPKKKWEHFKAEMLKVGAGGTELGAAL